MASANVRGNVKGRRAGRLCNTGVSQFRVKVSEEDAKEHNRNRASCSSQRDGVWKLESPKELRHQHLAFQFLEMPLTMSVCSICFGLAAAICFPSWPLVDASSGQRKVQYSRIGSGTHDCTNHTYVKQDLKVSLVTMFTCSVDVYQGNKKQKVVRMSSALFHVLCCETGGHEDSSEDGEDDIRGQKRGLKGRGHAATDRVRVGGEKGATQGGFSRRVYSMIETGVGRRNGREKQQNEDVEYSERRVSKTRRLQVPTNELRDASRGVPAILR
jgi:hypothetical protein